MMKRLELLLRESGIDPDAVLAASARTTDLAPADRVPYLAVDKAIERSCQLVDGLGLALARVRDDEAYGLAGLLLVTSGDLRRGLRRAFAYQRLWGDGERFTLREEPGSVTIAFEHPGASPIAKAVLAECALAELLATARTLVQRDAVPLRVTFAHAPHGFGEQLAQHFGIAPNFRQSTNEITFDSELVNRPLVLRRELLHHTFQRQCQEALDLLPERLSNSERVSRILTELADSPATITRIANRLRMSARTLQRQLRAEGTTFQQLVDKARQTRAAELLRLGKSHKQVALHLGYADPSGFVRARHRWKRDTTPANECVERHAIDRIHHSDR